MHLFDAATRFYGGNAIVGGGLPIAVGLALADKLQGDERVTACFFGEGAVAEGEFHESLNLAALWDLPVLFCCENNLYAMGTALERSESETDLTLKAASYEMPAWSVDGMDVLAVETASRRAAEAVRAGGGPHFLELRTYRFRAHSMYDPELYRDKAEVEAWKERDPLVLWERRLREPGVPRRRGDRRHRSRGRRRDRRRRRVRRGGHARTDRGSHALRVPRGSTMTVTAAPDRTTYREAMRAAIRDALRRDPRVFVMGEDVGRYGGCFAVTKGLLDEFGPERIRDTPLSESAFVGAGIGAALGGMRPIVEIMTVNFSLLALDQILNNAATLQYMSGGQFHVPLVIRMTTGAGRQLAAQHSHSLEGWYAHIPGIKILTPGDRRRRVRHARRRARRSRPGADLRARRPLQHRRRTALPTPARSTSSHAAVRRPGDDVSIITYGGTLPQGHSPPPSELAADGIDAEVIDLRVLRPLDTDAILASVRAHPSRRRRRRGVAQRQHRRRGEREDHRARLLRARRAGRARLQRRGPHALRQAPRGRRAPPGRRDRRRRPGGDPRRWVSS